MEFCDDCGSMMRAEDDFWVCTSCGHEQPKGDAAQYTVTEGQEETEIVDVSDAEDRGLPSTKTYCPECGNDRAYYYMQQIRSADESETRFFICTECENRWREDDN
ncbi:transcription factor S [Halarchaeum grantii]|uniref:Transcription factor S n=1 Tax=Halarchaeum grantii TaxID=1193105 RepID=A0A830F1L4_9EURY|nr:transcription factor S [Halarchaeum grantii]GGL31604.1 transcription factor S [Halarchaeum grantii]